MPMGGSDKAYPCHWLWQVLYLPRMRILNQFTTLAAIAIAALPLSAAEGQNIGNCDRPNYNKCEPRERDYLPPPLTGIVPDCKHIPAKGFWCFILNGTGRAMTVIKLSTITSVSKQTYMLEGAHQILEVTVDTTGNNSLRFYCLSSDRTNTMLDRASSARSLVDRHADKASDFPAKKYPEATHSHNVEFQLATVEQVNKIYESLTNSWFTDTTTVLHLQTAAYLKSK